MPIGNGGIIGPNNTPSTSSAKGVWSIREAMLAQRAGNWPVVQTSDPYFEYTTLLLPGNGTNGAQNNTFLDSSTNNFTITRNGNTTQGTFSPFSQTGWGNYFDGSGDYLTVASNAAFGYGTGDFTVECWFYLNALPSGVNGSYIIDQRTTATQVAIAAYIYSDATIVLYVNGGVAASGGTVVANQWNHFAICRSATTTKMFLNGTQIGSNYSDSNNYGTLPVAIASRYNGQDYVNGYISNFRIVKGTAVYTANFTPSTTPLTAITNTSLLTCQSNRFVDNSTNAFAITRNGDVSVQAFSPFNPTAAWSAATNGGSGYFDGSGDWLSFPDNAAFDIGLSNNPFTIELWYYPLSLSDTTLFGRGGGFAGWNGTDGWQYSLFPYSSSTSFYFQYWSGSGLVNMNGSTPASYGTSRWNHIAVSYDGTNTAIFINGTRIATNTAGYGKPTNSNITHIGKSVVSAETAYANGYISGARIVKGTAVYNPTLTTLTVPTAPVTAITNTSLLCNFTNAGIYDATSKNDLETVGNAQISTTQSKFGGSSIYLDGTGDYLRAPSGQTTTLTGDFTIEFWAYRNSGNFRAFNIGDDNLSTGLGLVYNNSLDDWFLYNSNASQITAGTLATTTWTHVAVVRSSGSVSVYVGGSSIASAWSSTATFSGVVYVGAELYSGTVYSDTNGYINDFRITNGIARYTSNFTPPTAAFQLL